MKIVLAPDSFKGSLSSSQICQCLAEGLTNVLPKSNIINMPMADGGEGTVQALVNATGGEIVKKEVTGPTGKPVMAFFGILGHNKTAVIEMSAASGLPLVPDGQRNPMHTTTYGTGELIKAALDYGCRELIVGIGGSATNDGGAGMAQALGFKLLDGKGEEIGPGGMGLLKLEKIDSSTKDPRLGHAKITVACDVDNPLCGKNGASKVYGPQKGATPKMVQQLDEALYDFSKVVHRDLGSDILNLPGSGAAGGLGGGLVAFVNASLKRGIDIVIKASGLEKEIKEADLVITGEGKMDSQTFSGKTPHGVMRVASKHKVPVIAVTGWIDDDLCHFTENGFVTVLSICPGPISLDKAINSSYTYTVEAGERIGSLLELGSKIVVD